MRCVFKYRLKRSDSTAGSRNESGSEFQTVGQATEKARVPKVLRRNRGIFSLRRLAEPTRMLAFFEWFSWNLNWRLWKIEESSVGHGRHCEPFSSQNALYFRLSHTQSQKFSRDDIPGPSPASTSKRRAQTPPVIGPTHQFSLNLPAFPLFQFYETTTGVRSCFYETPCMRVVYSGGGGASFFD